MAPSITKALRHADDLAASELPFAEAMRELLDAAQNAVPSSAWDAMRALPFAEDQALADRWLQALIDAEPPSTDINGLWFGIFHPIVGGKARPAYYVSGSPDYPAPDWPCNTAWWAEHRYAPSECLPAVHAIAERAGGKVAEWADYPLLYGFVACITIRAVRSVGAEVLLAGRPWLGIAIGFDSGDLRAFGELTDGGIDREAARARFSAWREANPAPPPPTPSGRALPPATMPDDGTSDWYRLHVPDRPSERGWSLDEPERDEDDDWEARMELMESLAEGRAPEQLPAALEYAPRSEAPEADWTWAGIEELPVVHAPLAEAITALAPEGVRLIATTVAGSSRAYRALVLERVLDCLDLEASQAVRMRDLSRAEANVSRATYNELYRDSPKIWSYEQVVLRSDRMPAGDAIFRIADLVNHIVVANVIARLLVERGTTGIALTPVPLSHPENPS